MIYEEQKQVIDQHIGLAVVAAVPGSFIPASDMPVLIGIWATMIARIGSKSGYSFSRDDILKHLTSATAGVGLYFGGGKLFGALLHLIPGLGTLTYVALNATLNAIFTNRLGKMTSELFNKPEFDLESLGQALESLVTLSFKKPPSAQEFKEGYQKARQFRDF